MTQYRYRAWDGTQSLEPFTPDDAMNRIAQELLDGSDLRDVLNRMLREGTEYPGGQRMPGMRDLMERAREQRERAMQRYNLDSVMEDIAGRLDGIVERERATVDNRLHEANEASADSAADDARLRDLLRNLAQQRQQQLDALPPDPGGRVRNLRDYDFMDSEARQQFEALLQTLQQQLLQHYFEGMQQALESMTPEALRQSQQMIHDLNELLRQRLNGQEPDFRSFMDKWGASFPEGIDNLDDLLDYLQGQMAQMQSLLESMSPEMRAQLQDLTQSLLQDHRIQLDLMEMASLMQALRPSQRGHEFPFLGDEPLTLQEALRLMGELDDVESLERDFERAVRMNDASTLDLDEIERLLGEDSRRVAERLQELTSMLEEAGLLRRKGKDWELTPRAVRKIGERALRDIFGDLQPSTSGEHTLTRRGVGLEQGEETRPYVWGDAFGHVDTNRTVVNAVMREGPRTPVHLRANDFEVHPTLALTQCSTVIMLDMSYSMMHGGRFQAGRRIALALDTLIRTKYPKDDLYVVAFSYFVLTLKPTMLLDSYWVQYGGGTNFQQAFRQARRILSHHHGGTKQIIFITDGEPTTYTPWGDNEASRDFGNGYRRLPGVLQETLREVARCTRDDITINTFILDSNPHMGDFLRTMAKVNRGRAFFGTAQDLGQYVLHDYVRNKRTGTR